MKQELNIPEDAFVVGFVGRLNSDKGMSTLVETVSDLRERDDVYFLIVGPSDDTFDPAVLMAASSNVRRIGLTDDVPKYLSVMSVLTLPTRREGFPNVVLEAAAAGILTITTRATGAIDSVVDGQTGLHIDVGDAQGLTDAIVQLASDPNQLKQLGDAASQRAEQDFQPERIWKGLENIYLEQPDSDVRPLPQSGSNSMSN